MKKFMAKADEILTSLAIVYCMGNDIYLKISKRLNDMAMDWLYQHNKERRQNNDEQ